MPRDLQLDDFHLRFEGAGGDRWQVVAQREPGGTTDKAPLGWPALPEALEKAWASRFQPVYRDIEAGGLQGARLLQAIGEALFESAFTGEVRSTLRAAGEHAQQRRRGLRIWIDAGGRAELERLPWEALFDRRANRFLAQSRLSPVVRFLEDPEPLRPMPLDRPLRILLFTASPTDQPPLEVAREIEVIAEACAVREKAGDVVLEKLPGATLQGLRRRLDDGERPCHVVHFIGHSGLEAALRDQVLVLEDGGGGSRGAGARLLSPLLLDHDPLQLLVLNSCGAARVAPEGVSPCLAQALMHQRIPAVVAMQTAICDRAAIDFARHLYDELAAGSAVDAAVARCRKAMLADGHDVDWAAPVLYLRAVPAPLLPATSDAASPAPDQNVAAADAAAPVPGPKPTLRRSVSSTLSRRQNSPLGSRSWRWLAALGALVSATLAVLILWLAPGRREQAPALPHGPDRPRDVAPSSPGGTRPAAPASPPEVPECPPAPELAAARFMRLGPGTFLMGTPHGGAANERPAHYVTLSPFCMGAFEVTRGQWREVMGEAAKPGAGAGGAGDELPVDDVSWDDVQVFLARLNGRAGRQRYRLPTEAEWEFAARAGGAAAYSFGDDPGELYRYGNCRSLEHDDGYDRAAPVGSFLPNRWGLYDLYGNVSEWVGDAYARYAAAPVQDPRVPAGERRVRRGGSWKIVPKNCRSAFRNESPPTYRSADVGFRLVRSLD
jgi:formylglycine-generating enzyme required for sulfatase activity